MIIFNTVESVSILFSHISITIIRLQRSSFIDIWLTYWEFQYGMLPPLQLLQNGDMSSSFTPTRFIKDLIILPDCSIIFSTYSHSSWDIGGELSDMSISQSLPTKSSPNAFRDWIQFLYVAPYPDCISLMGYRLPLNIYYLSHLLLLPFRYWCKIRTRASRRMFLILSNPCSDDSLVHPRSLITSSLSTWKTL